MLGFLQASLDTWTRDLEFHAVQVRNWGGGSDGLDRVLQKNGINSVCVGVCVCDAWTPREEFMFQLQSQVF